MRNLILRMFWDGQENPSVEVPLGDFFGIAHGRQRNMVTPYVGMQDAKGFNCFIPMPFKKEVVISIENDSDVDVDMFFTRLILPLVTDMVRTPDFFMHSLDGKILVRSRRIISCWMA